MNDLPVAGLRILVGAGSFTDAKAALRIVQRLPDGFCGGLGGILVEEQDLLVACKIPDQRVVLLSGAISSAPSLSQVRALLKADARAFQQLLARTAAPPENAWAFTQDTGDLVSTALRAAASWDVLVLGYRQIHKIPGKVVIFQTSAPTSDEMEKAFQRLSNYSRSGQITFSVKTKPDRATNNPRPNALEFDTLGDALTALTRQNAQAVLVDLKQGPVRSQHDLLRLLEAARCPVVVFGASRTNPLLEHNTQILPHTAKVESDNDG
jgi:hypothetical protein